MAPYRYQVVAVGLWRGKIKRWNTTFHLDAANSGNFIYDRMQSVCYPNPGDVVGDCSGGIASISGYYPGGGNPAWVYSYFDWQTPSTWIPYEGSAWSGVPENTPVDASGESALIITGTLPGLSTTGKPKSTRKYIHAIPSRTALDYDDPDIDATSLAALSAVFSVNYMLSPGGTTPTSVQALPYYGNHQRVRGRRRTTSQVAAQAFSLGVLAGGGATTSGQGEPFPGGEY